jgi:hypothetical protein
VNVLADAQIYDSCNIQGEETITKEANALEEGSREKSKE